MAVHSHNTLLLHIPLLALTYPQTELWRNEYTRCVWAGGTFFPVVLLCQVLGFWQEIVFGFTSLFTVLDLQPNLKETSVVKIACQVEATRIRCCSNK
jgi:hypothetical protein